MASFNPPLGSFLAQINKVRNEINSRFTKIIKNLNKLQINLLKELQSMELDARQQTEANTKYAKTIVIEWDPAIEQALQGILCKIKTFTSESYMDIDRPHKYSSSRGSHSDQLKYPRGLCIDNNSRRIYVADTSNNRIQIFKFNANCVDEITHEEMVSPKGICVSEVENRVFVTLSECNLVQAYRKDGSFVREVSSYSSTYFDDPVGIADNNSKVYVCDRRNNKVVVLDKNLHFITVLAKHINRPRDVKVRNSQVVILHEGSCLVSFYTRGGEFLRSVIDSYQVDTPYFFDIDLLGNIFITDTGNDCVKIFNCDGHYVCDIGSKGEGKGEFKYPTGIGLIPENYDIVVVCDRSHYQLQIFNPESS